MGSNRFIFIILLNGALTLSVSLFSQQQGQSSLYFFSQHFYNPSYIAINNGLTIIADGRNQWVNFKGAPKTANFSLYSSLGNNLAGGFSVQTDKIGVNQTSSFIGNIAYKISFKKKKNPHKIKLIENPQPRRELNHLAFGLSFGANYYQSNYLGLRIIDVTDDVYQDGQYSQTAMNVGFGAMYYNSTRFVGISIPTLIQNKLSPNTQLTGTEKRHLYFVAGFIKEFSNGMTFRPSTVIKMVPNAPIAYDINLALLIKERFWLGLLYKNNPALGFNTLFIISPNFRLGYAYEQQLTSMQRFTSGSHELLICYQIASKKKKNGLITCPKF